MASRIEELVQEKQEIRSRNQELRSHLGSISTRSTGVVIKVERRFWGVKIRPTSYQDHWFSWEVAQAFRSYCRELIKIGEDREREINRELESYDLPESCD